MMNQAGPEAFITHHLVCVRDINCTNSVIEESYIKLCVSPSSLPHLPLITEVVIFPSALILLAWQHIQHYGVSPATLWLLIGPDCWRFVHVHSCLWASDVMIYCLGPTLIMFISQLLKPDIITKSGSAAVHTVQHSLSSTTSKPFCR